VGFPRSPSPCRPLLWSDLYYLKQDITPYIVYLYVYLYVPDWPCKSLLSRSLSHGCRYLNDCANCATNRHVRKTRKFFFVHLTTNIDYPQIRKLVKWLQRIFNVAENAKICDMRTLLKYVKMRQSAKYAAITYSHFSDMPIQSTIWNIHTSTGL